MSAFSHKHCLIISDDGSPGIAQGPRPVSMQAAGSILHTHLEKDDRSSHNNDQYTHHSSGTDSGCQDRHRSEPVQQRLQTHGAPLFALTAQTDRPYMHAVVSGSFRAQDSRKVEFMVPTSRPPSAPARLQNFLGQVPQGSTPKPKLVYKSQINILPDSPPNRFLMYSRYTRFHHEFASTNKASSSAFGNLAPAQFHGHLQFQSLTRPQFTNPLPFQTQDTPSPKTSDLFWNSTDHKNNFRYESAHSSASSPRASYLISVGRDRKLDPATYRPPGPHQNLIPRPVATLPPGRMKCAQKSATTTRATSTALATGASTPYPPGINLPGWAMDPLHDEDSENRRSRYISVQNMLRHGTVAQYACHRCVEANVSCVVLTTSRALACAFCKVKGRQCDFRDRGKKKYVRRKTVHSKWPQVLQNGAAVTMGPTSSLDVSTIGSVDAGQGV